MGETGMDMRVLFAHALPRAKPLRKKAIFEPGFVKSSISAALNRNGRYNKQKTEIHVVFPQQKTTSLFLNHSLLIV
jgi:hypothetical protein